MIELIFHEDINFWGMTKNISWLPHVQQEIFQRDPQLHVFPQILEEKKQNDLFLKSKKSLLRNIMSEELFVLGMRWIAHLAFIRFVKTCTIARRLLTGLYNSF